MDPVSATVGAAGLGVGIASLSVQLFEGAVEAYSYLIAGVTMPDELKTCRLRLIMEYRALKAWAKTARLIEDDTGEAFSKTMDASNVEMCAIISEIANILHSIKQLNGSYNELSDLKVDSAGWVQREEDLDAKDLLDDVLKLELEYERSPRANRKGFNHLKKMFNGAVTIAKRPQVIRWKAIDKAAFESLLNRLCTVRERLEALLKSYQVEDMRSNLRNAALEMIQMRSTLDELAWMAQASLSLAAATHARHGTILHHETIDYLTRVELLTSMKKNNLSIRHPQTAEVHIKSFNYLTFKNNTRNCPRSAAFYQEPGNERLSVWIDWKKYEHAYDHNGEILPISKGAKRRAVELAKLLQSSGKPPEFCTPECVALIDDAQEKRMGWAFTYPVDVPNDHAPRSMRALMLDSKFDCPSLDDRIELAKKLAVSLLYLHGVNWLHKDIRSDNLILFVNDNGRLSGANLAGFQYSRPTMAHTSEGPEHVPAMDIYRWPSVQGYAITDYRSRKTYDIYALGLLLLELAHWKPIEHIMKHVLGSDKIEDVSAKQASGLRAHLLASNARGLAAVAGIRYQQAVLACLNVHQEFGIGDDELLQRKPEVGLKIQRAFLEKVVEKLQKIQLSPKE